MIFFRNIWLLFFVDLSKFNTELYNNVRNKKSRELNFEAKASISMKVHKWYRKTEFSDEMVKEAESIQQTLNKIFYKAEVEDEKKFSNNKPEVIQEARKPELVSGLGSTRR